MSFVTYELEGPVALIGLNRPDKRNAMSEAVLMDLREAVTRADAEADAAVLFGHGLNFSSGLDLAELAARIASNAPPPRRRKPSAWHETFDLIQRGGIPYVAALHGATIGGGLELACAAHIRVAEETTVFGLPEAQRGIFVGGGGTVRIQRILGYETMADMMLTGRMLSCEEGRQFRLVQYVVPPGHALARAKELAARIAGNPPMVNWQITNVLPRINDLSHNDGLFVESLNNAMARSPETLDRLRAFIEKRAEPLLKTKA